MTKIIRQNPLAKVSQNLPALLTVPELAQILRISKGSAYKLVHSGELDTTVILGNQIRIYADSVKSYLQKNACDSTVASAEGRPT